MRLHTNACARVQARAGSNYPFLTLKERDNETGLDYFGARYYASTQARFTSVDPIMVTPVRMYDPQQLNLYSYTRNNPLKFIDDGGMQTKKPAQAKPTVKINKPTVTRTTYDVTGATANEAIKNSNKHDGFAGETKPVYDVKWKASWMSTPQRNRTHTATATVTSVEVSTTITVDTPKWVDAAKAPEAEQKTWNDFTTSLNQHEDGHVAIVTQGATDVGNAVADAVSPVTATGKTSQEAVNNATAGIDTVVNEAIDTAVKEVNKRGQEYDDKTDHGRKKRQDE